MKEHMYDLSTEKRYVVICISNNEDSITFRFKPAMDISVSYFNLCQLFAETIAEKYPQKAESFIVSGFTLAIFTCDNEKHQQQVYKRVREMAGQFNSN